MNTAILDAEMLFGKEGPPNRLRSSDFNYTADYERDEAVAGQVLLSRPIGAKGGKLRLRLTDSLGRLLKVKTADVPAGGQAVPFVLAASNVRAMLHILTAHVTEPDGTVHVARGEVVFRPPLEWDEYATLNWHQPPAGEYQANWDLGVRGTIWLGQTFVPAYEHIRRNFRYYVENTTAKFYSPYHVWRQHKNKSYLFYIDKRDYEQDRSSLLAWQRYPCLSNPWTRERVYRLQADAAKRNRMSRPYFYSLGDEPGIADQAAPSDYCFCPWCRKAFRDWLDRKYAVEGSLPIAKEDILDWRELLRQVKGEARGRKRTPGKDIVARLGDSANARLKTHRAGSDVAPELQAEFLKDINRILADRTFYNVDAWRDAELPYEAADLIRRGVKNLSADGVVLLNRLALQAAYPYCISRSMKNLAAVNAQWETGYKSWHDLRAPTTDETFARKGDNFSPWCDHKDFMDDVHIVRGYGTAVDGVRHADPTGRVGGGGFQGPCAVGGWDYWKICRTLHVLEPYYIGNNYELIRSFNPDVATFTVSFGTGPEEVRRIWYLFIHGDRGCIIWNQNKILNADGKPSARGKLLAGLFHEFNSGMATQRYNSIRDDDPIAIYESQASLRVHWCLEVRPRGKNWLHRGSWTERIGNTTYQLRESAVKVVEDNGFQYRFICPAQVESGALKLYDRRTGEGFKALILPRIVAMSQTEAAAIRKFVKAGGVVISDGRPGLFDENGRRLEKGRLDDVFGAAAPENGALVARGGGMDAVKDLELQHYHRRRLHDGEETEIKDFVGTTLRKAIGADRKAVEVMGADGAPVTGIEVTTWRNGEARIVAIQQNPQLRINELGGERRGRSNARFEVSVPLVLKSKGFCYDARAGKLLGKADALTFTLHAYEPTILCIVPKEVKPFTLEEAAAWKPGECYLLRLAPGAGCPFERPVYHVAAFDPQGKRRDLYDQTVVAPPPGPTTVKVPFAANDAPGEWRIVVREVLTGRSAEVKAAIGGKE